MANINVNYTYGTLGTEHQLKIEVFQTVDVPKTGDADPNIFVYRKVGESSQYSHVATVHEMLKYPTDSAEILPKSDEKLFRQSQVVMVRGTKEALAAVRHNVETQINRLVGNLNAEVVGENPENVTYGDPAE